MKQALTVIATVLFLLAAHEALANGTRHFGSVSSHAEPEKHEAPKTFVCKYISGDVGTIVGKGDSPHAAQADAAEKCFDKRVSLFETVRGQHVDTDRGQDFIDSCVNLTCS